MAEEFPDYDSFFVYPKDHRKAQLENVNRKEPKRTTTTITTATVSASGSRVKATPPPNVYDRRQFQTEKLSQKSLPNLKPSYGSIYKSYTCESEPLLNRSYNYSDYLYADPVPVVTYRRSQVFLFFYIVFYAAYLIVGSICFQKLEVGVEQSIREDFQDVRRKFLADHPLVTGYLHVICSLYTHFYIMSHIISLFSSSQFFALTDWPTFVNKSLKAIVLCQQKHMCCLFSKCMFVTFVFLFIFDHLQMMNWKISLHKY